MNVVKDKGAPFSPRTDNQRSNLTPASFSHLLSYDIAKQVDE